MQDSRLSIDKKRIESALIFHLVIKLSENLRNRPKRVLLPFMKF